MVRCIESRGDSTETDGGGIAVKRESIYDRRPEVERRNRREDEKLALGDQLPEDAEVEEIG